LNRFDLGITIGHNSSITLLKNGTIVFYIEEERLSRIKRDGNPIKSLLKVKDYTNELETVNIVSTEDIPNTIWNGSNPYAELLSKIGIDIKKINIDSQNHHLWHNYTAFYNSGFDDSIVVVIDGAGSRYNYQGVPYFEAETIFRTDYEKSKIQFQNMITNDSNLLANDDNIKLNQNPTNVKMYEAVTDFLGWHPIEAGKTMGLSAYGTLDERIIDLLNDDYRGRGHFFKPSYPAKAILSGFDNLKDDKEFQQNIAFRVQKDTEFVVRKLIEKAMELNKDCKNICITGGYALNVISNGKLVNEFKDYNFWFEPCATDNGNSIGVAKHFYYQDTKDKQSIQGIKDYYLGFEDSLNLSAKKVLNLREKYQVSRQDNINKIATALHQGDIVAVVQGRSEAGARALGNRSFLFNATLKNGKDLMNKIKKREWFRPFACIVLKEDLKTYFETSVDEAPYMNIAFKSITDKIPAVTHIDKSSRVQTVDTTDNKILRKILIQYKELSNIGVLGNTSFNLSGEPLVETTKEALTTFANADFKYLYFADKDILITKGK